MSPRAGYILGRRLERLLYFEAIIFIFSICDYFLAAGAAQIRVENRSQAFGELEKQIKYAEPKLKYCHDFLSLSKAKQVTEIAEYKPYPTLLADKQCNYEKELLDALGRSTGRGRLFSKKDEIAIKEVFSKKLSPSMTIEELRKLAIKQMPILDVATIEAPTKVTVNLFGTPLTAPIESLSVIVYLALFPVMFLWMGSVYATRLRELVAISRMNNSLESYPHILNSVPIYIVRNPWKNAKQRKRYNPFFLGPTFTRALIISGILIPPVVVYAFATDTLSPIPLLPLSFIDFVGYFLSRYIWTCFLVTLCGLSLLIEIHPTTRPATTFLG